MQQVPILQPLKSTDEKGDNSTGKYVAIAPRSLTRLTAQYLKKLLEESSISPAKVLVIGEAEILYLTIYAQIAAAVLLARTEHPNDKISKHITPGSVTLTLLQHSYFFSAIADDLLMVKSKNDVNAVSDFIRVTQLNKFFATDSKPITADKGEFYRHYQRLFTDAAYRMSFMNKVNTTEDITPLTFEPLDQNIAAFAGIGLRKIVDITGYKEEIKTRTQIPLAISILLDDPAMMSDAFNLLVAYLAYLHTTKTEEIYRDNYRSEDAATANAVIQSQVSALRRASNHLLVTSIVSASFSLQILIRMLRNSSEFLAELSTFRNPIVSADFELMASTAEKAVSGISYKPVSRLVDEISRYLSEKLDGAKLLPIEVLPFLISPSMGIPEVRERFIPKIGNYKSLPVILPGENGIVIDCFKETDIDINNVAFAWEQLLEKAREMHAAASYLSNLPSTISVTGASIEGNNIHLAEDVFLSSALVCTSSIHNVQYATIGDNELISIAIRAMNSKQQTNGHLAVNFSLQTELYKTCSIESLNLKFLSRERFRPNFHFSDGGSEVSAFSRFSSFAIQPIPVAEGYALDYTKWCERHDKLGDRLDRTREYLTNGTYFDTFFLTLYQNPNRSPEGADALLSTGVIYEYDAKSNSYRIVMPTIPFLYGVHIEHVLVQNKYPLTVQKREDFEKLNPNVVYPNDLVIVGPSLVFVPWKDLPKPSKYYSMEMIMSKSIVIMIKIHIGYVDALLSIAFQRIDQKLTPEEKYREGVKFIKSEIGKLLFSPYLSSDMLNIPLPSITYTPVIGWSHINLYYPHLNFSSNVESLEAFNTLYVDGNIDSPLFLQAGTPSGLSSRLLTYIPFKYVMLDYRDKEEVMMNLMIDKYMEIGKAVKPKIVALDTPKPAQMFDVVGAVNRVDKIIPNPIKSMSPANVELAQPDVIVGNKRSMVKSPSLKENVEKETEIIKDLPIYDKNDVGKDINAIAKTTDKKMTNRSSQQTLIGKEKPKDVKKSKDDDIIDGDVVSEDNDKEVR